MMRILARRLSVLLLLLACAPATAAPPAIPAPAPLSVGTIQQNAIPGVLNFDPSRYQRAARGFGGVVAGTRRMKIGIIGDSTTAGYGSTTGDGGYANMQPNTWPTRLAQLLGGEVAAATGFNGVSGGIAHAGYDPRMTFGTGWTDAGTRSLGGQAYFFPNGGGTAPLGWKPGNTFDHIRIWFANVPGNGLFSTNVSGGTSLGTTNSGTGGGVGHVDYVASGGPTDTINIVPANGQLNIFMIEAWNAAAPKVGVFNFAQNGAKVADYLDTINAWSAKSAISAFSVVEPFDLWIVCLDINDSGQLTGVPAYQPNLTTLIQTLQAAGGDVLLMGGTPSGGYEANRPPYVAAEKAVALAFGIAFIDRVYLWTSYSAGNALGYYFSDGVHISAVGQGAVARTVVDVLRRM